ncbi:hypothetical protein EYV94_20205 [Puteibacter caeruleilacunae]|nr:hypothetical protein EYV94_20205 [Puteibacter caeruleilacunae]
MRRLFLFCLLSVFALVSWANDSNVLGIVPQPKEVRIVDQDHQFVLNENSVIQFKKELFKIADFLTDRITRATGYELSKGKSGNRIVLEIDKKLSSNADAYTLFSNENEVIITGASQQGLFWGVQTLLQLFPAEIYSQSTRVDVTWSIPSVEIIDEPLFTRYRGLQMDISRHFRTKEEIMETIDMMAMHKMNTLHLHFSDDEGWRIESKVYPKLTTIGSIGDKSKRGEGRSFILTQKEVKELIAYANDRFIKIFPEIDMPGHMLAVIRSYPELASKSDKRDDQRVIRIDEKGEEFCRNILREISALFGSSEIHLGFDEVNLGSKEDIYNDEEITAFAQKMAKYVKEELKMTPVFWDDAFEKGLHDTACLMHWWRYGKIHWWSKLELTMDQKFQKYNQPYIMSPANYTYFDMRNLDGEPGAGWAKAINVAQIYAWDPFGDLVDHDKTKDHLAQGIICATWSEGIKTQEDFEQRVYPRLATMSEKCWNHAREDFCKPTWTEYRDVVLMKQLKRYNELGINYWSKGDVELLKSVKSEKK